MKTILKAPHIKATAENTVRDVKKSKANTIKMSKNFKMDQREHDKTSKTVKEILLYV